MVWSTHRTFSEGHSNCIMWVLLLRVLVSNLPSILATTFWHKSSHSSNLLSLRSPCCHDVPLARTYFQRLQRGNVGPKKSSWSRIPEIKFMCSAPSSNVNTNTGKLICDLVCLQCSTRWLIDCETWARDLTRTINHGHCCTPLHREHIKKVMFQTKAALSMFALNWPKKATGPESPRSSSHFSIWKVSTRKWPTYLLCSTYWLIDFETWQAGDLTQTINHGHSTPGKNKMRYVANKSSFGNFDLIRKYPDG